MKVFWVLHLCWRPSHPLCVYHLYHVMSCQGWLCFVLISDSQTVLATLCDMLRGGLATLGPGPILRSPCTFCGACFLFDGRVKTRGGHCRGPRPRFLEWWCTSVECPDTFSVILAVSVSWGVDLKLGLRRSKETIGLVSTVPDIVLNILYSF